MKIKELTPEQLRCGIAGCPAVFEVDDGKLLVIGKIASKSSQAMVPKSRIANDEILVEIPRELVAGILRLE